MNARQAPKNHQRVRQQHARELAQDYLEVIHQLLVNQQRVTVTQLQAHFGVSHVTVIRTLQRLEEQGYLENSRSKQIQLSAQGKKIAQAAAARHQLLRRFFIALGVSEAQAEADAEGAEHHLSQETLQAIEQFLEKQE